MEILAAAIIIGFATGVIAFAVYMSDRKPQQTQHSPQYTERINRIMADNTTTKNQAPFTEDKPLHREYPPIVPDPSISFDEAAAQVPQYIKDRFRFGKVKFARMASCQDGSAEFIVEEWNWEVAYRRNYQSREEAARDPVFIWYELGVRPMEDAKRESERNAFDDRVKAFAQSQSAPDQSVSDQPNATQDA